MSKKIKITIAIVSFLLILVNGILVIKLSLEDRNMNIPAAENYINDRLQMETVPGIRITVAEGFYYEPLSEDIKEKISGKSFRENDIIDYSDLRLVTVRYIGFDDMEHDGVLIVNVQVADDVAAIFKDLYDARYQIEKIRLIDEYNADDDASMADNNTSAFCFRQIDGQDNISDHSYGIAVDINPLYNPYVRSGFGERNVLPVNAGAYADRTADFEHKIIPGDVCYNAFVSRGWKWGGEWDFPKDYQHFYKEIY